MTEVRPQPARAGTVTFQPMTVPAAELLGEALSAIDPWAHYNYTPSALAEYLAGDEAGAPRFAIIVDQKLAGAIGIRRNWLRGPYLQFLGILPPFQQRGVGSAALSWFETDARAGNAQNVWVAASDFNARAQTFYERHGFIRVAAIEGLVVEGVSEILFRKRLSVR
jgi:ribosomal protein S18 acetylase RimI-like enzyme